MKILNVTSLFKKITMLMNFSSIFSINFDNLSLERDILLLNKIAEENCRSLNNDSSFDDYFRRSFLQYKCQMSRASRMKKIILDLIAVVLFPFYIVTALICKLFISSNMSDSNKKPIAVLAVKIKDDLIQRSLTEKYTIISPKKSRIILDKSEFKFLRDLFYTFPFHPYFVLKCMAKISIYSYYCTKYNPEAIIAASEYSFTSSILTCYLERQKVKHINVMHGEKIYNIRDSFFRFSEYFVWNQYYVDLFRELMAYPKQFHIELPPRHYVLLEYKRKSTVSLNKKLLKFYWASEVDDQELKYITEELTRLQNNGVRVVIRNHPVHGEYFNKKVKDYFHGFPLEDPSKKDIYESLAETDYVFGTYTTVLYEAILMGKVIVINDFRCHIDCLDKMGFYVIKKGSYIPLSALLERLNNA